MGDKAMLQVGWSRGDETDHTWEGSGKDLCVDCPHSGFLHQPPCAAVTRSSLKHRPDWGSNMLRAMADNMPADSSTEDELMGDSRPGARQKPVRRLWR